MLRINLVPEETIKNTLWWILPCFVGTVVALILIIMVRIYLDSLLLQTTALNSRKTELDTQIASLKEKNKEFDPLDQELSKLTVKIEALQQITSSKNSTYRPLIILELLQKLKPDQIWFQDITIEKVPLPTASDANKAPQPGLLDRRPKQAETPKPQAQAPQLPRIILSGGSTDPEAISKFMQQLEVTKDNLAIDSDLRTKVYFKDLKLSKLSSSKTEKKDITNFEISFDYAEKSAQPVTEQKDI